MIKRMILISTISAALIVIFAGCKKNLKDFSFSYSMESMGSYKTTFSIDSDKNYKIETHNYFMDNRSAKRAPIIKEGTLTDEEYETMKKMLEKCNFFKMKDSYGFEEEPSDSTADIMYQIQFQTSGKTKYISFRNTDKTKFPASFVKLISHIGTFMSNQS